jgi:hypothetical protein
MIKNRYMAYSLSGVNCSIKKFMIIYWIKPITVSFVTHPKRNWFIIVVAGRPTTGYEIEYGYVSIQRLN